MQVTILGITGGVGNAVANAFLDAGHTVVALARDPRRVDPREGLTVLAGDVREEEALRRALTGSDVVLHALNLPYPDWDPHMITLTEAVLAGVQQTGATLLFPSNVYGLGPDFTDPLTEDGPYEPPSRKGALRNRIEQLLADSPTQTVLLRAGDFFGGIGESSWMHHLTSKAATGGAIQYPTSLDNLHQWAFLPDLAATFVKVAERRDALGRHAVFHFGGHVVDGHTWVDAARAALGDPTRRQTGFPWMWLQFARPFVAMVRELFEMRYLWDQPVRLDGSKLEAFLGEVPHTPWAEAMHFALGGRQDQAARSL